MAILLTSWSGAQPVGNGFSSMLPNQSGGMWIENGSKDLFIVDDPHGPGVSSTGTFRRPHEADALMLQFDPALVNQWQKGDRVMWIHHGPRGKRMRYGRVKGPHLVPATGEPIHAWTLITIENEKRQTFAKRADELAFAPEVVE